MRIQKCDICKREGVFYPKQEAVYKEVDGVQIIQTKTDNQMNLSTGKIEQVEIPVVKDLEPRAILIVLQIAGKTIQRDVCQECYESKVRPVVLPFWNLLENIESC